MDDRTENLVQLGCALMPMMRPLPMTEKITYMLRVDKCVGVMKDMPENCDSERCLSYSNAFWDSGCRRSSSSIDQ